MMCSYAEDPNGIDFKWHLARVPDYLWVAEDGMKMQSFGSQLWDCTLLTQAIMASNMVDEYGDSLKKAHFYVKESQVNCLHSFFANGSNFVQLLILYLKKVQRCDMDF